MHALVRVCYSSLRGHHTLTTARCVVRGRNILADGLAQHGSFVKLDGAPEVLSWETRLPLIVAEISNCAPHIVSLVELNRFGMLAVMLHTHP